MDHGATKEPVRMCHRSLPKVQCSPCYVLLWVFMSTLVVSAWLARWRAPFREPEANVDVLPVGISLNHTSPQDLGTSVLKELRTSFGPRKLLLVSHYRGGSTFLGDLFGQSEQCMYWFEPLRAFLHQFNQLGRTVDASIIENAYYKMADNTLRHLPDAMIRTRMNTLRQVMTCDVSSLDRGVLHDTISRAFHSPRAANFSLCTRAQRDKGTTTHGCGDVLQNACRSAAIVVAKTVRTPFYMVSELLDTVPDLRVIYYTRDPRAVINSRKTQLPPAKRRHLVGEARNLCLRMTYDRASYLATDAAYPGRILHVVYEDLAFNPVEVTIQMYRFMGMELPAAIEAWIEVNTHAQRSSKAGMSTHKNSTHAATRWVSDLDPEVARGITAVCRDVLQLFGYPVDM